MFGVRSPGRPNPIGLTSARVLGVEGRVVRLDRLDMIDGTLDSRHQALLAGLGLDILGEDFEGYGATLGYRNRASFLRDMLFEAENFHGERCVGAALGARMVDHAIHHWGIAKKEPAMRVGWGPDGCINDALQAITGATSGNGRLDSGVGKRSTYFRWEGRLLRFRPREGLGVEEVLSADLGEVMGVGE